MLWFLSWYDMIGEIRYSIFREQKQLSCRSMWKPNTEVSIHRHDEFLEYLNLLFIGDGSSGENHVAYAQQVHGNKVMSAHGAGLYSDCDGLITGKSHLKLIIRTADCAAVMLFHPGKKVIANLHVGWRGAQQKIIQQGVHLLIQEWQVQPQELLAAVSPFIQSCCFEVGKEFYKYFEDYLLIERKEKNYFDFQKCIREQLIKAGIQKNLLEISPTCTRCSSLELPSHRRDKTQNRLINMIEITGD
jgi:purine-nucleoside/S-methyl-5'-thioadenosine phosphorylase / adenosine deaminase